MNTATQTARPLIFDYRSLPLFIKDTLVWRKREEPSFSIRKETRGLRRCSATLVSHIIHGKRKLTVERVDAVSRLLKLTPQERAYLAQRIVSDESGASPREQGTVKSPKKRKEGQNHLLTKWLNVYVKDACRLRDFRPDAGTLYKLLGGIASKKQIQSSLRFLLREGYLRRTLGGRMVENDLVMTTTDELYDKRKQQFHRKALEIARRGISLYPWGRRRESALILTLNESSVAELKELLKEFYERLLLFAEAHPEDNETLYQVLVNLSPIGGRLNELS